MRSATRTGEAREWLDRVLAADEAALPTSSMNMFRAERMKIAANWDEFLKYAVRIPAGTFTGFQQYGNSAIDRGDEGTAKTLATLLQELAPALKEPLQAYLEANNAGSRNCATTFLMLRFSRNAAVCTVGVRTSAADGQAGPGSRQLVVPVLACGRQSTRLRSRIVGADGAAARVVWGRRPKA